MIPISKPRLAQQEALAAARVIQTGWLVQGPEVAGFEEQVARFVGSQHAVAASSGTAALHLALLALDLQPGDEVVVPALGFIATANVVLHVGARPVFVDVDPRTFNIDPVAAARAVSHRTRAIIAVHQLGLCAEMDPLQALATEHDLCLLEDAACALGASYRGQPAGHLGRLGCFSFHPRKVITTGEGGMITTDDHRLADRARALRSHGMAAPADPTHPPELAGFNYRMTDIQGAVGQVQMGRLPGILERRRDLALRYHQALLGSGVVVPHEPLHMRHAFQSYMVLLPDTFPRDAVLQQLQQQGISCRGGLMALHRQPVYRRRPGTPACLPVTEEIERRGLMLPLYPDLTEEQQDRVVQALTSLVG